MDGQQLFLKKKKAKRDARRGGEEKNASMGLTSLMDIVAIIVVYLLKSYASDPILIQPIAGQEIPMSKIDAPLQDGQPIYISSRELMFDEQKLVQLKDGELDPNSVKNHMIAPLYEKLLEEADVSKQIAEARGEEWSGRVILIRGSEPEVLDHRRRHVHRRPGRISRVSLLRDSRRLNLGKSTKNARCEYSAPSVFLYRSDQT